MPEWIRCVAGRAVAVATWIGLLGAVSVAYPDSVDAAPPTPYEQYLIELVNRDRADPAGAAARYGIDLNEGLAPGTISSAPKQPLAINTALTAAAHDYVEYLRANGLFSHIGPGTLNPGQRMANAGYANPNTFGWGENLGYHAGQGLSVGIIDQLNRLLFVDAGVAGRGHRTSMLAGNYVEVGAGVATGPYSPPGGGSYSQSVMVGEDFAYRGGNPFITGVAYDDVNHDIFYQPGEGLGGVTILATRQSTGQQYAIATWDSGGYSLRLPAGIYDVAAFGGSLGGTVFDPNVTLGATNLKFDFRPSRILAPGDATADGVVDAADYTLWADHFLSTQNYLNATTGDYSGDGVVDAADYTIWADHFRPGTPPLAAVPEPATWMLGLIAGLIGVVAGARRRC